MEDQGREVTVLYSDSAEQTEEIGRVLAVRLRAGDVVALRGAMGSGKTALVRGVASVLAPGAHVSSPTFALVHCYQGKTPVLHADLWRMAEEEEEALVNIGFYDYLEQGAILLIEWSEVAWEQLPPGHITVWLESVGDGSPDRRRITVDWGADRGGPNRSGAS